MEFVLIGLAILPSVTFHELAHGLAADRLGDPTARHAGRLTLNPIPHIDPIGALMFFLFKFGWAKPVPVNPGNFREPLRHMALTAAAGPLANVALAFLCAQGLKLANHGSLLHEFLLTMVWINCALAVLNLLPLPPLDGSRILPAFLNPRQAIKFYEFERYGFVLLILIFFFAPRLLHLVIYPPMEFLFKMLTSV